MDWGTTSLQDRIAHALGGGEQSGWIANAIVVAGAADMIILSPHYCASRDGSDIAIPAPEVRGD